MPGQAPAATDERELLAGYVGQQQDGFGNDGVRRLDLETAVPVPRARWNPRDVESCTVRWVWLHLVEELARHAGIIREAIDGATMYEVMAGREGWPETDWLKPWRRSS